MKLKKEVKLFLILLLIVLLFVILKKNNGHYFIKSDNMTFEINQYSIGDIRFADIIIDSVTFTFNYSNNYKSKKIINDIKYYDDNNYKCVFPIDGKNNQEVLCYYNGIFYNYSSLKNKNKNLDEFVGKIEEYKTENFTDNKLNVNNVNNAYYFSENKVDKMVAFTTYKGLIINENSINIFEKDVYNNKLGIFVEDYYIVADYNQKYEFNIFYKVNLKTQEVEKIKSKNEISFNSYYQGIVNNYIYIYDINSEKQYEIDIYSNKIKDITADKIKYYSDGKWSKISKAKANKKIEFNYDSLDNYYTQYDIVKKNDIFAYLFKKENNKYKLYRSDLKNEKNIKFLFEINTNNISISKNYIYFLDDNILYYYSDMTGLKSILKNTEFKYNKTIMIYIN